MEGAGTEEQISQRCMPPLCSMLGDVTVAVKDWGKGLAGARPAGEGLDARILKRWDGIPEVVHHSHYEKYTGGTAVRSIGWVHGTGKQEETAQPPTSRT